MQLTIRHASKPQTSIVARVRGLGWQRGQKKDERFMKCSRTIDVTQR